MWKGQIGFAVMLQTLGVHTARPTANQNSTIEPRDAGQIGMYNSVNGNSDHSTIPISFSVSQNYPNPFNLETTIDYSLPTHSGVYVTIYDIKGEHVTTLKNNIEDAGNHRVIWNGTNCRGVSVASGIYLFRLVADDFYALRKMIMIK